MKTDIQDGRVYRYLLGDLPEAEQLALEQMFLTDNGAFERVWEIENQLVDRYVRGRLTAEEKKLFEQNYLASPVHRERVQFATNLIGAADSATENDAERPRAQSSVSWRPSFLVSTRRGTWRWAMAAAVVALAVVGLGLFRERGRLQSQISRLNEERASELQREQELEKEMAAERERNDKVAAELESLREDLRGAEHPGQGSAGQKELRSVVSFLLSPVLVRSSSEAQKLTIPHATDLVALQMKVGAQGEKSFQVAVQTVEGRTVWTRTSIKARPNGVVSVTIPATRLDAGDYILTLAATRGPNEAAEEINRYFFRVAKQ